MIGRSPTSKFVIAAVGIAIAAYYFLVNPASFLLFPTCPFYSATDLLCPACGGQRSMHHLVHGRVAMAFEANALLIPGALYAIVGMVFNTGKGNSESGRSVLAKIYGPRAFVAIAAAAFVYAVVRNLV